MIYVNFVNYVNYVNYVNMMFGKVLITIAMFLSITLNTSAFSSLPIRMTLKNDIKNKTGRRPAIVDEMLKHSKICTKKSVAVDTIILNIYKINKFFINSNSPTITLSLKDKMENVYYLNEQGEPEKLMNTTSIVPNTLRNFFVYELDADMDIDCIMYKS